MGDGGGGERAEPDDVGVALRGGSGGAGLMAFNKRAGRFMWGNKQRRAAPADMDYVVTVCAACLCASCWHGEFYCEKARSATTVEMRASELRKLKREHSSHFSIDKIVKVTGSRPRLVGSVRT